MKRIFLAAAALMITAAAAQSQTQTTRPTCKGTTKTGAACRSTIITKGAQYCTAHNPAAIRCGAKTKAGTACRMAVKEAGTRCRFHTAK